MDQLEVEAILFVRSVQGYDYHVVVRAGELLRTHEDRWGGHGADWKLEKNESKTGASV